MSLRSSSGGGGGGQPPWQVLVLVAHHLDPKTLAMASCVCKSWFTSMSSDHLWQPICSTHFPSLSTIRFSAAAVPYCRLYALGRVSTDRRLRKPPKPHLSLHHLIFTIAIHKGNSVILAVEKPGSGLDPDPNGLFRFDIDVSGEEVLLGEGLDGVRLTWNVVLEGYKGVFTMLDCEGKGRVVVGTDGWFSEELPSPGCCSGGGAGSGLAADMRLGLWEGGGESGRKVMVEKVGLGVLSVVSWRYVYVDDALRYLQHFLMPSDV